MPDAKLTPEEKLLRIIESPPEKVRTMRPRRRIQDFKFSLKLFIAAHKNKVKDYLNLKTVNAVLVFLGGVATVFLVLDFWIGSPRLLALEHLAAMAKKQDIGDLTISQLDPLSAYLEEATKHNIFSLPPVPAPVAPGQPPAPTAQLTSMTENLKVVGIIWSDAPQVIIEDSKEGRTYLLNRGSRIKDARVKEILKDRVILSYDSQEIELR